MSGILGIWNRDGRPVDRSEALRLRMRLAHRGGDSEGLEIHGDVGFACCLARIAPESATEVQPLVNRSGVMIVFDGRLDNRDELVRLVAGSDSSSPDAALALAAYQARGDKFAEHLTGDFALGLYDPRRKTLLLARDAVGARPLYYYATPALFLFASEIKALLVHADVTTEPDADRLAEFLFTSLAGEDTTGATLFRGIHGVLPAHLLSATHDGIATRRYWDFDPGRRMNITSIDEAGEAFRHAFERAVRRRLRSAGPVAVSVSGGVDSSAIFSVAQRLRTSPGQWPPVVGTSYTSPDGTPSDEKSFLLDLERGHREKIVRFDDLPEGIVEHGRELIWHAEMPLLDSHGARMHHYLRGVRQRGARVLLTGHWGDQFLSNDAYLIDLCSDGQWRSVRQHLAERARWLDLEGHGDLRRRLVRGLIGHCAPAALLFGLRQARNWLRRAPESASWYVDSFRRRMTTAPSTFLPHRHGDSAHSRSIYRAARCRYHAVSMEWNNKIAAQHGLEIACPFLDRDLIALLMALPGELIAWNGVPKGLMRRALSGVLPEVIAQRASKADFTRLVNQAMAIDHDRLIACVRDGQAAVAFGYVRPEGLVEAARARPSPDLETCTLSWALKDLLSLELWLQQFFGTPRRTAGTGAS